MRALFSRCCLRGTKVGLAQECARSVPAPLRDERNADASVSRDVRDGIVDGEERPNGRPSRVESGLQGVVGAVAVAMTKFAPPVVLSMPPCHSPKVTGTEVPVVTLSEFASHLR